MDEMFGRFSAVPEMRVADSVARFVEEILTRYGSIEAFCERLHLLLDAPTDTYPEIFINSEVSVPGGRHRLREA
ncbi:hypothetical protein AB0H76_13435 [Nocardia sp. NPDC050712]|uniref:hypothetical protein n=1 Tax=Nocardia sp. NPDC050712 TaxID=3155518 RepID=UPI00340D4F51